MNFYEDLNSNTETKMGIGFFCRTAYADSCYSQFKINVVPFLNWLEIIFFYFIFSLQNFTLFLPGEEIMKETNTLAILKRIQLASGQNINEKQNCGKLKKQKSK